jgi:hypothetical protein
VAEQTTERISAVVPQTRLVCRLRHRGGRFGPSPTAGEVEIENTSAQPIEIEFEMHPFQYLDLTVTDPSGTLVSEGHYGNIFSPRGGPTVLHLGPGEKYAFGVALLGNVPPEKHQPGCYLVRACYRYKDVKAVSEPLQVKL